MFRDVSIHAPGKGATKQSIEMAKAFAVSIHAPGKGATEHMDSIRKDNDVSIHAPGKGATLAQQELMAVIRVSIHAPGKGATCDARSECWRFGSFNPRAREGRDGLLVGLRADPNLFQSTRPGRARRTLPDGLDTDNDVSIHAPGKGATPRAFVLAVTSMVSIHAPGKGATE